MSSKYSHSELFNSMNVIVHNFNLNIVIVEYKTRFLIKSDFFIGIRQINHSV